MRFLIPLLCAACFAGQRAEMKEANDILASGEYARAAARYRGISQEYPGCEEAKYNLGICLLESGESKDGEDVLRKLASDTGSEKLADQINSQLAYHALAEAVEGLDDQAAASTLAPEAIKDKEQKLKVSRELLGKLSGKDPNAGKGLQVNKTYSKLLEEIKQQQQQNQQQNSQDKNEDSQDKQDQQNSQNQQSEQNKQDQQDQQNQQSDKNQQQNEDKQQEQQENKEQQSQASDESEQKQAEEQQAQQDEQEMTQEQEEKASEMAKEILQNEKDKKKMRMRIMREQTQVEKDW